MKAYIAERSVEVANFIINNNATIKETATKFGISKSTVYKDITEHLVEINPNLASKVKHVLEVNINGLEILNNSGKLLIYMDTCCFNRPYDDLSIDKVNLESDAILTIVDRCERHIWDICSSDVLDDEIYRIKDTIKKEKVLILYNTTTVHVELSEISINRAKELNEFNIKAFDSLHIASAEYSKVDVFITTDKKLINASKRVNLKIKVVNPIIWLMGVLDNE